MFLFVLSVAIFTESYICGLVTVFNSAGLLIHCFFFLLAFQTEGKLYLILDFLRGGDVFTRLSKEVS